MIGPRRQNLRVVAIAAVWLVGGCECRNDTPSADAGDPVAIPSFGVNDIVLIEATGYVEARRAGEWSQAQVGDKLSTDDVVRARAGAATVAIGETVEVAVDPRSEVSFGEVDDGRARVKLERGRLRADLAGEVVLEVESAGSSAVAEGKRGSFAVFNDGHGQVAVASQAGEVHLESAGGAVSLRAGEQAAVAGDAAPTKAKIPESVYLKVRWPDERMTRQTELSVRGSAEPSSRVEVNGRPVEVAADGSFEAQVELEDGRNRVEVRATDLYDRSASQSTSVLVRRRAPKVKAKSEGIWE